MGVKAELAILDTMLPEYSIPEPGCCGMAGPFGFDALKYDVSMRIAQRALLPAVRAIKNDVLIVADGFSCREQFPTGHSVCMRSCWPPPRRRLETPPKRPEGGILKTLIACLPSLAFNVDSPKWR